MSIEIRKIIEENKRAVCSGRTVPGKTGIFFRYLTKLDYVSGQRTEDGAYALSNVPSGGDGRLEINEGFVSGLPDTETKWFLCKIGDGLYIRPANERERKPTNTGAINNGNIMISGQDVAALNPSTHIEYDGKVPHVFYDLYVKIIKDSDGSTIEAIVAANPFPGAKKKSCRGVGGGYGTRISATFRGERAKYVYDEELEALRFSIEVEPVNGRRTLLSDENTLNPVVLMAQLYLFCANAKKKSSNRLRTKKGRLAENDRNSYFDG